MNKNVFVEPAVCAARPRRQRPAAASGATNARTHRWAFLIARRYGLTLDEGRAELRRLAAKGWMSSEFRARFSDDQEDGVE